MKIARIKIKNFRGIKDGEILFPDHVVLVGDNNSGKSTILEAIDLVLGPERLSKHPVIDEHDFYTGQYIDNENNPIDIQIEVILINLTADQQLHFRNHLEFWNKINNQLIEGPPPEATDDENVKIALRIGFKGYYDLDEDDFFGETFFLSPTNLEGESFDKLSTRDKRKIGFLYLRTLRTGTRALSLERGSLLDIILKLKEIRPQMWEDVLSQLHEVSVAKDPELGISDILISVQEAVRKIVPVECADSPSLKVSHLTREHLRKVLTVFMGTGVCIEDGTEYLAPYTHQGTGTINILVLTLLSIIAELKQNVIFAMEEPETAIPPHTQKRVINSVIAKSSQAIFTSHSPYVLEEVSPSQIISINRLNGVLTSFPVNLPPAIKEKMYREEIKRRFCEAILARRILIVEGRTEYDVIRSVSGRLEEIDPSKYSSLDSLGISIINAMTDTQIAPLGDYFRKLGKITYAIFDKQEKEESLLIKNSVDYAYESAEKGIENVILNESKDTALKDFALAIVKSGEWPTHLKDLMPTEEMSIEDIKSSLRKYFKSNKGEGAIANFLEQCTKDEMPKYFVDIIDSISCTVMTKFESKHDEPTIVEEGD